MEDYKSAQKQDLDQVYENHPKNKTKNSKLIWLIIVVILIIGLIVLAFISLFGADLETTSKVRDIFIIIMAFESLLLGVALVILIYQIAVLINVLKNDVKMIMDTTNETMNHLKGTTEFLSNNLVEPVIKVSEYSAGVKKLFDLFLPSGKSKSKKS